jgi:aspartyl/asparaginyl-tRNA synthetase
MNINEHYSEVMDIIETLFMALFDGLAKDYATELAVIGQQYPFEPLEYCPCRLTFEEGIKLLQVSQPAPHAAAQVHGVAGRCPTPACHASRGQPECHSSCWSAVEAR